MSEIPPHMTTSVRVAQRGWSGQICDLSHLWVSFFFLFCFLQRAPKSHFLTDWHDLYAKTRVFGQGCAFWGPDNIRLHLGAKPPKNLSKMGENRHFAAKSATSKIAISVTNEDIRVLFHTQIQYRRRYRKSAKLRNHEEVKWPTFEILRPLYISGTVKVRNCKFGTLIEHVGALTNKMQNWVKGGREGVTWPTFKILGPPPYLGNSWS